MVIVALVLVVSTVALAAGVLWSTLFAGPPRGPGFPSGQGGRDARLEPLPAEPYAGHRWSERRPRLELTESGIRRTGHQVRFCLDCPAEKSDELPRREAAG
ncbi:hypothetical protein SAMN04488543_0075 [Friedmanniella luteola]|uniref:Uncharacterized protein n=1 Tax=Friedmanniella luteola TaxID=546871 RepID=A0A1H1L4D1_9ACTN|nr:hypothetical protein [Friedmanniella luteola]SDR69444.1 hypothetical protein SAMN04488543_0075 [Friedmanniella luteola]